MAHAAAELGCKTDVLLLGDEISDDGTAARHKVFMDAAAAKPDGIALVISDPEAWDTPVAEVIATGVPVIGIYKDDPENPRLFFIGQDEEQAAYILTKKLIGEAKERNVNCSAAHTALASENPDAPVSRLRANGVRKALIELGLKSFEMFDACGADGRTAESAVISYIAAHPQTLFIMGADKITTEKLSPSLEAAGKTPGDLFAGGFGVSPLILDGIAQGYLAASVDEQPYLQGYYAVYALRLYKNGGLVSNIDTGGFLVTPENAEYVRHQLGTYR